jgi:hypothetical protein
MTELSSLVLFTGHIGQALAFYRAIGLSLDDEDHGDGPVHYATEVSRRDRGPDRPGSSRAHRAPGAGVGDAVP